ncbi:MAG: NADH-quinone oxidoreductase subunit H [Candidatus Omnitrophota bacterium]
MTKFILINILMAFIFAPLLMGIINRTKAFFAGRRGQPLLQLYYDIYKLLNKSAVYSRTTTWIFRAGPVAGLSAVIMALLIIPYGTSRGLISFDGDLILLCYLFGIARFFTVLAALDTGSSFEGMGAGREIQFAVLAEPAFLIALAALAREAGTISLSAVYSAFSPEMWAHNGPLLAFSASAVFLVFLAENSRVPVDDPNTHLELTMIHEVMALDHCGPDLAFILYGASLKFWVLGALFTGILVNRWSANIWVNMFCFTAGMAALSVLTGMVESVMARLRMNNVPMMLVCALAFSVLALLVQIR